MLYFVLFHIVLFVVFYFTYLFLFSTFYWAQGPSPLNLAIPFGPSHVWPKLGPLAANPSYCSNTPAKAQAHAWPFSFNWCKLFPWPVRMRLYHHVPCLVLFLFHAKFASPINLQICQLHPTPSLTIPSPFLFCFFFLTPFPHEG